MGKSGHHYQGTLDGLCGHYAIINALMECGALTKWEHQQQFFKEIFGLCPEIYEGMPFDIIRRVLAKMQARGGWRWSRSLSVTYPFDEVAARQSDGYLDQLHGLLSPKPKCDRCALLQIQRYSDDWDKHWIVIKNSGKNFEFIDSILDPNGHQRTTKRRKSLIVGSRKPDFKGHEWHFPHRKNLVLFEKAL